MWLRITACRVLGLACCVAFPAGFLAVAWCADRSQVGGVIVVVVAVNVIDFSSGMVAALVAPVVVAGEDDEA